LNPVFDATPPEYIDAIVTEIGVVPPSAAYEIIVRQLGQEFIFESNHKW
jgi:ribose 1,5-bisphosphate isomerase